MTQGHINRAAATVRWAWATLHLHWRAMAAQKNSCDWDTEHHRLRKLLVTKGPLIRRLGFAAAVVTCVVSIPIVMLGWRLAKGPVSLDAITPWLTSAIEQRLGNRHHIEVGGTQLERTEEGRTALRMRDIVVRDSDGTVVASAPKAEVGISGRALLSGQWQAERLSLIGAAMAIRVEADTRVTVFAGSNKRPIATAPPIAAAIADLDGGSSAIAGSAMPVPPVSSDLPRMLLRWLDSLDAFGLDGRDLTEIGLKNGTLDVDDQRTGKRWTVENINLSLTRPKEGGVALAVNSHGTGGPWSLTATVTPRANGRRAVEAVMRDVSAKDLLRAFCIGDGQIETDIAISAILRAEIAPDGMPHMAEARIIVGTGYFGDAADPEDRVSIDRTKVSLQWDSAKQQVVVPVELQSGANRITFLGQFEAPRTPGGPWGIAVTRGLAVLGAVDRSREAPLILDHISLRGRIDSRNRRIEIDEGDVRGAAAGIAFSGTLDYSGTEARLSAGLAGTRMSASALKRIWPVAITPKVRSWIIDHFNRGTVERLAIATNAPLVTLKSSGPPVPMDGLTVEIVASGTDVRPFAALPAINDADLTAQIVGRRATVRLARGTAELPSGRKLAVSDGVFEVADTHPKAPPARVRFRVDGSVDAAAELVASEPLRESADLQLDPATSRGTVTTQVTLAMPIVSELTKEVVNYTVDADVANFAAERLIRGHKVEAALLRINANPQGLQIKGDVRIGGNPAAVDYRKPPGHSDAEVRMQTNLDDAARSKLGLEFGGAISGSVPVKLSGRIGSADHESRLAVEADLTAARIVDLLPGWNKPAGKTSRATFVVVAGPQSIRFEDFVIDGSGTLVKGMVEVDGEGDIVLAHFPSFGLSENDKASLKAERAPDGTLRAILRGDVYDGRGFIKGTLSGPVTDHPPRRGRDLDLDVKIGAMVGFHGEALRSLDLKLSRRAGQIRTFTMNAKLRDATLSGDLRAYADGRAVVYFETDDAGALFRFTDTYPRMFGGQMWVAMDPPAADRPAQDGIMSVRGFAVRGEPALEGVAASEPAGQTAAAGSGGVQFTRMRVEFTRSPGKLAIRDGVVNGPAVGATMEGQIDYLRDRVSLRGTFIPAYALMNLPAQIPILGVLVGGGQNEGLFGVTYEVVGPPHAPTLRVNPMSAVAPGFLRKFFEFRRLEEGNGSVNMPGAAR
jgi:Protein of unknown function/AsmA-like C-terminal region